MHVALSKMIQKCLFQLSKYPPFEMEVDTYYGETLLFFSVELLEFPTVEALAQTRTCLKAEAI